MPETYVREWLADLLGASREYTGSWDMSVWLKENIKRWDYCHPETLARFANILQEIGYPVYDYSGSGIGVRYLLLTPYNISPLNAQFYRGSPAKTYVTRLPRFNLILFIKLFPFDHMVFGQIDNAEYFTGLKKYITGSLTND